MPKDEWTEEKLIRVLATLGIKPHVSEDGTNWWHKEDFEAALKLIEEKKGQRIQ